MGVRDSFLKCFTLSRHMRQPRVIFAVPKVAQRPTKTLLTLGTRLYDELL